MRKWIPLGVIGIYVMVIWTNPDAPTPREKKPVGEAPERFDQLRILSFVNGGQFLVAGGWDKRIHIWQLDGDKLSVHVEKTGASVLAAAAIPKSTNFVLGDNAGKVTIWDCSGKHQARELANLSRWIKCIAVSSDGSTIVAGTSGGVVCTWSAATGKERSRRQAPMKSVIHAIAFAPDGKSLFVGDDFGTITQLEAKTLLRLKRWVAHKRSVYALAVARNGQYMISGSLDGQVKAWSGTGFKLIRTWRNKGPVFTVDISPDNKLIATANGDRHVRVWDWKKQIEVFSFRDTGMVHTVAFSPDGTKLASGSPNNCLYLWDLSARPNHLSFSLQSP